MFQDPVECYQAIADELVQVAPEAWMQINVEAERTGQSSIDTKVTFYRADGSKGSIIDVVMLPKFLYDLASLVSTEGKGLYKVCRFVLYKDGHFDVKFEY